jgi:hypothetical protein
MVIRKVMINKLISMQDYPGQSIAAASTTDFSASHQLTEGPRWTLDHCCINNGPRRLLIMCYGTDRLARCEAKNGKVRKKQAPQCCTAFKACFSTQLTDRLRWTLYHCCIDNKLRRLLISSPTDYAAPRARSLLHRQRT